MNHFKGWYNDKAWKDNELFQSNSVASFHLSMSRGAFRKTGGYNEGFPHAGFEDYDFPKRLMQAGLTCCIDSRVAVFHNEADRLQMMNWLQSWKRRAMTRKVAVTLGYKELSLDYGWLKKLVLTIFSFILPVLVLVTMLIPNRKIFDKFYSRLVSGIQAVYLFKGYTSY